MALAESSNNIMRRLPESEREQLLPLVRAVDLAHDQLLVLSGQTIQQVWFPETCVISHVAIFEGGLSAEMAATGREGIAPVAVLLHADRAIARSVVQVPGKALQMSRDAFAQALERLPVFRTRVALFGQAFLGQVLQSVACNAVHSVHERCARWILFAHDRTGMDTFELTQEYLAELVGVSRPSVSLAAKTLQAAGLIRYTRGTLTVLDREGLEDAACECYGIITRLFEERLGEAP